MWVVISERLVQMLAEQHVISNDDIPVYQFGLQSMMMNGIHIITYAVIGLFFHQLIEAIIFTVAYVLLREYAGGYHAATPMRCYLLSCLIVIAAMLVMKSIPISGGWLAIAGLLFLSAILVFFMAPVDNLNKPLDSMEVEHYKKHARIILLVEIGTATVLLLFGVSYFAFVISLSLTAVAAMLVVGMIQNKFKSNVKT